MFLFGSESSLRQIVREEMEAALKAISTPDHYMVSNEGGGDIIMPNPIREQFDRGEIKSLADIL